MKNSRRRTPLDNSSLNCEPRSLTAEEQNQHQEKELMFEEVTGASLTPGLSAVE